MNLTGHIATGLVDEDIASPYVAPYAASSAVDTLRRHRFRTLLAVFAPEALVQRWHRRTFDHHADGRHLRVVRDRDGAA